MVKKIPLQTEFIVCGLLGIGSRRRTKTHCIGCIASSRREARCSARVHHHVWRDLVSRRHHIGKGIIILGVSRVCTGEPACIYVRISYLPDLSFAYTSLNVELITEVIGHSTEFCEFPI